MRCEPQRHGLADLAFRGLGGAGELAYQVTEVKIDGSRVTASWSVDGPSLVVLFSLGAGFFVARSLYRAIRTCLDEGIRVPGKLRLISWEPCLLLLPLLIQWNGKSVETIAPGVEMTKIWGYGSDTSALALGCAALLIIGFQIHAGLGRFIARHRAA